MIVREKIAYSYNSTFERMTQPSHLASFDNRAPSTFFGEWANQPTYVYVYVCLFENKSDWQKMGELPKTELHKKFFETEPRIRSSFKEEILIYLN